MAEILPFRPYRYTTLAGELDRLVTQPYDKITPAMQSRYLAASPYSYVRIILGPRQDGDTEADNVYTRAAGHLRQWIGQGVLAQDPEPAFYPYFQEFTVPETGEKVTRKAFIGLGPAVEYEAGIVHRHELTLTGPKEDRLALLRHVRAHTGQLFLLYSDPEFAVEALLDEAAAGDPLADVTDEYGVAHRMWRLPSSGRAAEITRLMAGRKLLIADGHHRYETALAFARENPGLPAARRVMMTLVNLHSPGLKILATHRLLHGRPGFDAFAFAESARPYFRVSGPIPAGEARERLRSANPSIIRIGLAAGGGSELWLFERGRGPGETDVAALHSILLTRVLGISEEDVREQRHIHYVRGLDAAVDEVRIGNAQAAFLLAPASVEQVAEISFAGGVMPQKSTDFYPKLLDGLTICLLDD